VGGYKSYRRAVQTQLYDGTPPARFIVLDGDTGSGKTELLHRVAAREAQVLDLEGLANHRGSIFGFQPGGQPSQKAFESALAEALRGFDLNRPVLVEAESSKIGRLNIPPAIWAAMEAAPRFVLDIPAPARAAYLAKAYADLIEDGGRLLDRIEALRPYHPAETVDQWLGLANEGAHERLAHALIVAHYDPSLPPGAGAP
jgi:tRNA 2-selenouridine synthase